MELIGKETIKINISMLLEELFIVESARMAWARKGNTIVKKYRCTSGRRKGRIVSKPAQCTAPPDIKKRATLRRTKAKMGARMARKTKRTKRLNPASRRLKRLNIPKRKK